MGKLLEAIKSNDYNAVNAWICQKQAINSAEDEKLMMMIKKEISIIKSLNFINSKIVNHEAQSNYRQIFTLLSKSLHKEIFDNALNT